MVDGRRPTVSEPPALLESTPYGEIIAAMSEAHGVDPLLVRALIQVESNYRPKAKSARGRHGPDAVDALDRAANTTSATRSTRAPTSKRASST